MFHNTYDWYNKIPRHKVFISYYHNEAQYYKDELLRMNRNYNMFLDLSVHQYEINDEYLKDEEIRREIRDHYIRDSTVTILLCSHNCKHRKFVDWEMHATMFDSEKNPKGGILVINLPWSMNRNVISDKDADSFHECTYFYDDSIMRHSRIYSNTWYREYLPDLPERVMNSICNGSPISVIDWNRIQNNPTLLCKLIDNTFNLRWRMNYDTHTPLRRKNGRSY